MKKILALYLFLASSVAGAAALTDYAENKLIDQVFRAQTALAPATLYVGLVTSSSADTGCGTEVSGGSYARVAVTSSTTNWAGTQSAGSTSASSGTGGTTSNNAAITFPAPTASWGTVTGFCIYDASTSGNALVYAALTASKNIGSGDAAPSFAIGALTVTIDN